MRRAYPVTAGSGAELAQWMCQVHNVVNRRSVSLGFDYSVVTSISIVFLKMYNRWTIMDPTVLFWDFMQSLKFIFLGVLGSFPQDLYLAQNVMKL